MYVDNVYTYAFLTLLPPGYPLSHQLYIYSECLKAGRIGNFIYRILYTYMTCLILILVIL